MSIFSGPQPKGAKRLHKDAKHGQALVRQANVQHDRTRAHRLGKCACEVSA